MANASSTDNAVRAKSGRGLSISGFGDYLRGVREELRKAKWPTREELIRLTQVVLAVIAIVAAYVGGLDAVLSWVTRRIGFGI